MSLFICPVCRESLSDEGRIYRCTNGHCFDKSKFGYVNLLQSRQSSAKRHGDDRIMVRARRDFLDSGAYAFLRDKICGICTKYLPSGGAFLDAGCGEGYYASGIKNFLSSEEIKTDFYGVDISKDALEYLSKRKSGVTCAVASLFNLPFSEEAFDCVLNIFSPEAFEEFRRVLKKGGYLIRVIPCEKHLFELKAAVYDKPYLNEMPPENIEGFECVETMRTKNTLRLSSNEEIQNLFKMTPYYYKTGVDDQNKLSRLGSLETGAEFEIRIYRKDN